MEYSPPPLFKQGASARAKVVFFSLIALILLVADARMRSLGTVRQVVGTMLYPLQVVALLPRDAAYMVGGYFSSLTAVQRENEKLSQQHLLNAQSLQQLEQLAAENAHLRRLLEADERLQVNSIMSEILHDARDAFTRKIVLDRGANHGVQEGQPVIDDAGVVGQVTHVRPFSSEVTLLTDKDQAIPVQVVRSGLRSIAYGQGHSGSLDLRFMPANADIKIGDLLVTSGIDGVYPPGLAVGKVVQVESKSSDAFARITCQPLAGIDRNRQLLILMTDARLPPRDAAQDAANKADASAAKSDASAAAGAATTAPQSVAPAPKASPAAVSPGDTAPAAKAPPSPRAATASGTAKPASAASPPAPASSAKVPPAPASGPTPAERSRPASQTGAKP